MNQYLCLVLYTGIVDFFKDIYKWRCLTREETEIEIRSEHKQIQEILVWWKKTFDWYGEQTRVLCNKEKRESFVIKKNKQTNHSCALPRRLWQVQSDISTLLRVWPFFFSVVKLVPLVVFIYTGINSRPQILWIDGVNLGWYRAWSSWEEGSKFSGYPLEKDLDKMSLTWVWCTLIHVVINQHR